MELERNLTENAADTAADSAGKAEDTAGAGSTKKNSALPKIIIIAVIAIIAAAAGFRIINSKDAVEITPLSTVSVTKAANADIYIETSLVASKSPDNVYYVTPKAAGEILEKFVKQGDIVKQGDPICRIDNQKSIDAAKITLDQAEVQVNNLNESLALVKTNLDRMQVLYASGDISKSSYESTKSSYDQTVASLEAAKLSYDGAKLQYDTQVEFATVTAPADGRIESESMTVNSMAAQSTTLAVISSEGDGKLTFNVTDRLLKSIHVGDSIKAEKQGSTYEGKITSIDSMPGAATGLYAVEAAVDDGGALATGASVKVWFTSDKAENVLAVETDSVYYDGGKTYVYTISYNDDTSANASVAEGNKAATVHKKEVSTGLSDQEHTQITDGISTDDLVIRTWTSQLFEGAQVQVLPEEG